MRLACSSDTDLARPFLPDAAHTLAEILGLGQPGRERKGEEGREREKWRDREKERRERGAIQKEVKQSTGVSGGVRMPGANVNGRSKQQRDL